MTAKREERPPGRERKVLWGSGERAILRGQVTMNYAEASEFFQCAKSTVYKRLMRLKNLGQIETLGGTRFTIVTINKYTEMQPEWSARGNADGNAEETQGKRRGNVLIESENLRIREFSPPPPPLPLNRAEASERRTDEAHALIIRCQKHAERYAGRKLADFGALPKMVHLATLRGGDTILETFEHFAHTRRKDRALTFDNFFNYYDQHEASLIEAMRKGECNHEQGNEITVAASNGNGTRG